VGGAHSIDGSLDGSIATGRQRVMCCWYWPISGRADQFPCDVTRIRKFGKSTIQRGN